MNKAEPPRIDWRGADLRGANLSGMDLEGVDFRASDLRGVNFSGSMLRNADFRGAQIQGANFQNANLFGAKMQGVEAERIFLSRHSGCLDPAGHRCNGESDSSGTAPGQDRRDLAFNGLIARFDPRSNTFIEFSHPSADAHVGRIEVDRSRPNRLWWAGDQTGKIGYIETLN